MEERVAKNIDQLIQFWKDDIVIEEISDPETDYYGFDDNEDGFKNITIDFKLLIPFKENDINSMEGYLNRKVDPYKFTDCTFKKQIKIHNNSDDYVLAQDCFFEDELKIRLQKSNLTFFNCSINNLNLNNAIFGIEDHNYKKGKVRFHSCTFFKTNFRNAKFYKLADFWNSTFHRTVTFYKTDFLSVVVFSATSFKENLLFTYTLFADKAIFRGAKFEKGLDLSLAILKGDINLFDLKVKYFKHSEPKNEEEYEIDVSTNGNIPLKNKQETYRILKKYYEKQSNNIKALDYKYLERSAQSKANLNELIRANTEGESITTFLYTKSKAFANQFIHILNICSNAYGKSYILGTIFTLLIGTLFFSLSMLGTSNYEFSINGDTLIVWDNLKHYLNFLNPTHKFNYLGSDYPKESLKKGFYIWDFVGRIFVGYGIYQTIQAFRKYK